MTRITVNNFVGMASDTYGARGGEFAVAKHFDVLSYPKRLQPLRGMTTDAATNSLMGNLIVAADGAIYGIGSNDGTANTSVTWLRPLDYTGVWTKGAANNANSETPNYDFLVDWPESGHATKTLYTATTLGIYANDPAGATAQSAKALTYTTMGQGFIHPTDKILYIPYQNSTTSQIYSITPDATPFNTFNATALTLPKRYRCYNLCDYGNYLACPGTTAYGAGAEASVVFLWNRVSTSWDEQIKWGGQLKVLNNLEGTLIGISTSSFNYVGAVADSQSLIIKGFNGGSPFIIKELFAQHLAASSGPTITINNRVNFISKGRLYFSANIVPNDGVSNSYYGLWSVGRNKLTGEWSVNLERVATDANTETGVLAAAMSGDFVSMIHTAAGTLTVTKGSANPPTTSSTSYSASSVHESVVNPQMPDEHKVLPKQLSAVSVSTLPLLSGQTVVMKYRVDSVAGTWTTVFTKTSTSPDTNLTNYEAPNAAGVQFTKGFNYEFQLISTGGAVITDYSYAYSLIPTAI